MRCRSTCHSSSPPRLSCRRQAQAPNWTYTLIPTLLIGVAGHGLMVFTQRTIPIGVIGVAQVVQPALAVMWSVVLLSEDVRGWQVVGIAVAVSRLAGFQVLNRRSERPPGARPLRSPLPVEGLCHASHSSTAVATSPDSAAMRAKASRPNISTWAS